MGGEKLTLINMWHVFLKKVRDDLGIQNRAIAEKVGRSPAGMSHFFSTGRGFNPDAIWQIVLAMEELQPGARAYFGKLVSGVQEEIRQKTLDDWILMVLTLSDLEASDLQIALGQRTKLIGTPMGRKMALREKLSQIGS